jgi:hypothetical protein
MFGFLIEEIRLETKGRPKALRTSRKKVNRAHARTAQDSEPLIRDRNNRTDAKNMVRMSNDRENKLAPQVIHNTRKAQGAKDQSPERQAKYKARIKYDWQK